MAPDRIQAKRHVLSEEFLRDFADRWHAGHSSSYTRVMWEQSSTPTLPRGQEGVAAVMKQLDRACPDLGFFGTRPLSLL